MEQNPFSLSNKTVLVTGASSGIGRAISIRCSEMGANIILTARNQSRLQETLYQMSGKNHIELAADLIDKASMDNLVEQLPDLDGIVHCAGVNHRIVTKLIEPADIEQTISPNLVA
ncbi:MAG: SDR family NAD(P)-dependent oxidoreductase, partial [Tannerella forsythia]